MSPLPGLTRQWTVQAGSEECGREPLPPGLLLLLARLCGFMEGTAVVHVMETLAAAFPGRGGGSGGDEPPAFVAGEVARCAWPLYDFLLIVRTCVLSCAHAFFLGALGGPCGARSQLNILFGLQQAAGQFGAVTEPHGAAAAPARPGLHTAA